MNKRGIILLAALFALAQGTWAENVNYIYYTVNSDGGKDDTYVSYANSEAVMEAFPEMATLEEPAKVFADHLATCILWLLSVTFGVW